MNESRTLGQFYVELLKSRENLDLTVVDTDKVACMEGVVAGTLQIIERLALFAAAVDANLTAVNRQVEKYKESNPEQAARLDQHVGDLKDLKTKVLDTCFSDEAQFCRDFERMVRDTMARQAGIDPKDEAAVMEHMTRFGRALAQTPPGQAN